MPAYELFFSISRLPKSDLVALLKRIGEAVLDNQGIIRKLEYLGTRNYADAKLKSRARIEFVPAASFFVMHTDIPPDARPQLHRLFDLENNMVKYQFTLKDRRHTIIPDDYKCTLSEELLPPSFRPSVRKLIEEGRKTPTPRPVNYGPHGKRWLYDEEVVDLTE